MNAGISRGLVDQFARGYIGIFFGAGLFLPVRSGGDCTLTQSYSANGRSSLICHSLKQTDISNR